MVFDLSPNHLGENFIGCSPVIINWYFQYWLGDKFKSIKYKQKIQFRTSVIHCKEFWWFWQEIDNIYYETEHRREWCSDKGKPSSCFLFARKFTRPAALRLLTMVNLPHIQTLYMNRMCDEILRNSKDLMEQPYFVPFVAAWLMFYVLQQHEISSIHLVYVSGGQSVLGANSNEAIRESKHAK